ncbi:hypothetical protein ACSFA8_22475 [Variovorax sp. RT4R15]|uniref:hypothetical protein n=1 Tax=Variovorax sp. RT4R15 TaxID=3443737 RepID=UPI003F448B94
MMQVLQSETLPETSRDACDPPEAQAAAVVLAYLDNTQLAFRQKAYEVLRELATQTMARAQGGKSTEFTAVNLKAGVAPEAGKEPSAWLSPHWTRLLQAEAQWQEGMVQEARRKGLAFIPRLQKQQGNPSYYKILPAPIPEEIDSAPVPQVPAGGIYYTTESVAAPGSLLSNALRAGSVPWTAATRWSFALTLMAMLVVVLASAWLLLYFGLRLTRPLSPADLATIGVFAAVAAGLIGIFRFFGELFELRIVMAPTLLTPLSKDNVTLELRSSTSEQAAQLVFARYTSTCLECGGSIELFDGGKEFSGRIVGRCRRSAREHVYSFDHVGKIGRAIR